MSYICAFSDHLRHSPRRYASETINKRVAMVRRYCAAVGDPFAVNVGGVERWATRLDLSPSSTRDALSHVRAFYKWAIREGLTLRDPTEHVERSAVPRRLPRPARDAAIAAATTTGPPQLRAMVALMAGAGLRCCEVSRLRWSDVDLMAGQVHLVGKGHRERVLQISAPIRRAMAAIDHPGRHVFVNGAGTAMTAARVSQIVNAHLRSVGAGCTAHQLRHRFATAALAECHDITTVRDLLGHSSVAMTEIYAAVVPGAGSIVSRSIDVPGL